MKIKLSVLWSSIKCCAVLKNNNLVKSQYINFRIVMEIALKYFRPLFLSIKLKIAYGDEYFHVRQTDYKNIKVKKMR